jgi:hypothetical protein
MRHAVLLVAVLLSAASASSPPPAKQASPEEDPGKRAARWLRAAADKPVSPGTRPVSHAAPAGRLPEGLLAGNVDLAACETGKLQHCVLAIGPLRATAGAGDVERVWQAGCQAGNPADCFRVALLARELYPALELTSRACHGDVFEACYMLAILTQPLRDDKLTTKLYERTCAGGVAEGCLENGSTAEHRRSDPAAALGHYTRACALGAARGCNSAKRVECKLGRRTGAECQDPALRDGDVFTASEVLGGELGGDLAAPPPPPPAR